MKAGSSGLNSSGAPSTTGGVMSFMAISLARTHLRRERAHLPFAEPAKGRKIVSSRADGALASLHVCTDPGTTPRRPDQAQRHVDPLRRPPPHLAADHGPGEPHR